MLKWLVTRTPSGGGVDSLQSSYQDLSEGGVISGPPDDARSKEPLYQHLLQENSRPGPVKNRIESFQSKINSNSLAKSHNPKLGSFTLSPSDILPDRPDLLLQKKASKISEREVLEKLPESEKIHIVKSSGRLKGGAYVTDDPLATISGQRKKGTPEEIYAVSRLNPLYTDEENGDTLDVEAEEEETGLPDSPTTDHNSVRSSGYGSKENDSASDISEQDHDEEDDEIDRHSNERKRPKIKRDSSDNAHHKKEVVIKVSDLDLKGSRQVATLLPTSKSVNNSESQCEIRKIDDINSNDDPVLYQKNRKYVGSVHIGLRRVKSLETVQEAKEESESPSNNNAVTVPSPVWPKVNRLTETLQRQADRIYSRRKEEARKVQRSVSVDHRPVIRFNPLVSVVTQNSRYVTAISVSPRKVPLTAKTVNGAETGEKITYFNSNGQEIEGRLQVVGDLNTEEERLARYFSNGVHSSHFNEMQQSEDYPIMSLQPDSLINEDTLRMMTYPDYNVKEIQPSPIVPKISYIEDVGQVMYTRGLYATLNRNSLLQTDNIRNPPFRAKKEHSSKILSRGKGSISNVKKKKGIDTVRDLWEKTGLKTNGRKLLVDLDEVLTHKAETDYRATSSTSNSNSSGSQRCSGLCRIGGEVSSCDCGQSASRSYFGGHHSNVRDPEESSRSLSSMSLSSADKYRKNFNSIISGKSYSSEDRNPSSIGTSLENFGIDNFAFVDDSGHHSQAIRVIGNANNIDNFDSKRNSSPEHEYSELQEVIVERDKLRGSVQLSSSKQFDGKDERNHRTTLLNKNKIRTEEHKPSASGTNTNNPAELKTIRSHLSNMADEPSVRRYGTVEPPLELELQSDAAANGAHQSASNAPGPSSASGMEPSGGGRLLPLAYNYLVDSRNKNSRNLRATHSRRLSPHPNSGALTCREDTLCADFTLDGQKAERLTEESLARSRRRRCCRWFTVIIALGVFMGVMVAVSWYLTGGQRFFGSM